MIIEQHTIIPDRLCMGKSQGYVHARGINYGDLYVPEVIRVYRNGATDDSVSPGVVIMVTFVDCPKRKP